MDGFDITSVSINKVYENMLLTGGEDDLIAIYNIESHEEDDWVL